MRKIKMWYSALCCTENSNGFFNMCSGPCDDPDYKYEESISKNIGCINCPYPVEFKNVYVSISAEDVNFSGVTYNDNFEPVWQLKIDDASYDCIHCRLIKLCIDGYVVYDITQDDVHYWYRIHENEITKMMLDSRATNIDGNFLEKYCRESGLTMPCDRDTLYRYITGYKNKKDVYVGNLCRGY